MPHYKLVPTGHPEIRVDEIVLSLNDETGEAEHSLSIHRAKEIPEDLLEAAQAVAAKMGFRVDEAEAPPEEAEEQQPVGADVAGQAQVGSGAAGSAGDQADSASSATTASGVQGSSETSARPAPGNIGSTTP